MEKKELKEALVGAMEVAIAIAKVSKDGLQVTDIGQLTALLSEPTVAQKLMDAVNGFILIPEEAKTFELKDVADIVITLAPKISEFTDALKK